MVLIGSLFANAGVDFNAEEIVNSQPSDNTIQRFVEKNAVNTMILIHDIIRVYPNICVSANKIAKKVIRTQLSSFVA